MNAQQIFSKQLVSAVSKANESAQSKGEGRVTALIKLGTLVAEAKISFQEWKQQNPESSKGVKQAETLEALFNFGKMQQSRLERAAQVPTEVVESFFKACRADSKLSLSIEGLLKFAEQSASEGEEGEGEGEGAQAKPLLSLSCRLADIGEGENFSLRIMADKVVKTTAKASDIRKAIALLEAALLGFPEGETEA